jgi:hypothetical protein
MPSQGVKNGCGTLGVCLAFSINWLVHATLCDIWMWNQTLKIGKMIFVCFDGKHLTCSARNIFYVSFSILPSVRLESVVVYVVRFSVRRQGQRIEAHSICSKHPSSLSWLTTAAVRRPPWTSSRGDYSTRSHRLSQPTARPNPLPPKTPSKNLAVGLVKIQRKRHKGPRETASNHRATNRQNREEPNLGLMEQTNPYPGLAPTQIRRWTAPNQVDEDPSLIWWWNGRTESLPDWPSGELGFGNLRG